MLGLSADAIAQEAEQLLGLSPPGIQMAPGPARPAPGPHLDLDVAEEREQGRVAEILESPGDSS
ncbi:MAG: hypothetical protein WKF75_01905 [Singulisphaera sp.]